MLGESVFDLGGGGGRVGETIVVGTAFFSHTSNKTCCLKSASRMMSGWGQDAAAARAGIGLGYICKPTAPPWGSRIISKITNKQGNGRVINQHESP